MAEYQPGTFEFIKRPSDSSSSGFVTGVQASCCKCGVKQWRPAHNTGQGHLIFRRLGWQLGRHDAGKDICPGCADPRKAPVSEPPRPKVIENPVMAEKLTAAIAKATPPAEPWPDFMPYKGSDGATYKLATRGFSRRDNAARSALRWFEREGNTHPKLGHDYLLTPMGDGTWAWHPPDRAPALKPMTSELQHNPRHLPRKSPEPTPQPIPQPEPAPVHATKPRQKKTVAYSGSGYKARYSAGFAARELLKKVGIPDAVENYHYMVHAETGGTFGYTIRDLGKTVVLPPPPDAATPPAGDVPPPTREQRRALMAALAERYDSEAERYRDDYSDAKVAEIHQCPVAWVTQVRAEFYGDHDRNEAADQAQLDASIQLATETRDRLLDMAAQAEAELAKLLEARQKR